MHVRVTCGLAVLLATLLAVHNIPTQASEQGLQAGCLEELHATIANAGDKRQRCITEGSSHVHIPLLRLAWLRSFATISYTSCYSEEMRFPLHFAFSAAL